MNNSGNAYKKKYIFTPCMALETVLDGKSCFLVSGKTIETKARAVLDSAERVWSQQTFLKENAPDFRLKEIEERQHESRLHLVCICLPTAGPVEVWTWIKMSYSRQ